MTRLKSLCDSPRSDDSAAIGASRRHNGLDEVLNHSLQSCGHRGHCVGRDPKRVSGVEMPEVVPDEKVREHGTDGPMTLTNGRWDFGLA